MKDRISCICVTHNRVDMLERAISCFQRQTHGDKELVILFENDPVTEQFVTQHPEYDLYTVVQERMPGQMVMEAAQHNEIREGSHVLLRNAEGYLLDATDLKWIEPDTSESGTDPGEVVPSYPFTIETNEDQSFALSLNNQWLVLTSTEDLVLTDDRSQATHFRAQRLLNGQFLISRAAEVPADSDPLTAIGWEKRLGHKRLGHKGRSGDVVFHKVVPAQELTLGMKRNLSIMLAGGDYVCVWDDDDWYDTERLTRQLDFLKYTGKKACSIAYNIFFDTNSGLAYHNLPRVTGQENTLLFERNGAHQYASLNASEDTPMLLSYYNRNQLAVMEDPELYIYNYHKTNTCSSDHFQLIINTSVRLSDSETEQVREILDWHEPVAESFMSS